MSEALAEQRQYTEFAFERLDQKLGTVDQKVASIDMKLDKVLRLLRP